MTTTSETTVASLPIIVSAVVISVIFVVVAVTIAMYVLCVLWRKRDRVGLSHHSISYRHSPQLRADSTSEYCNGSEFSNGTNITQIGNGSHTLSPCADKMAAADLMAQANMMNPPPSPISTIQLQPRHSLMLSEGEDGMSTFSHGFSEYNAPPPPCPSINYDNVSGNMSFSVSQTHFPATINASNNNYHYQYPPQGGVGGGGGGRGAGEVGGQAAPAAGPGGGARGPGRNLNPLLARNPPHQQFGNAGGGGGAGGGGHLYQLRNAPGPPANHVPYANYHHHSHAHPDITESIEGSDTDSTVSITTDNPDVFPYDASMPHLPPPGRPPSPATVYSEYPTCSHRSPRSSTASYTSEV